MLKIALALRTHPLKAMKNELMLYQSDTLNESIEVKIEDDTVWLSQQQMCSLFKQTKQNISLHINNCFKENELDKNSTVKESLTVQNEGGRKVSRELNIKSYVLLESMVDLMKIARHKNSLS